MGFDKGMRGEGGRERREKQAWQEWRREAEARESLEARRRMAQHAGEVAESVLSARSVLAPRLRSREIPVFKKHSRQNKQQYR